MLSKPCPPPDIVLLSVGRTLSVICFVLDALPRG